MFRIEEKKSYFFSKPIGAYKHAIWQKEETFAQEKVDCVSIKRIIMNWLLIVMIFFCNEA